MDVDLFKLEKRVNFQPTEAEPTTAEFYMQFNQHNRHSPWIFLLFFLTCSVEFCSHLTSTIRSAVTAREVTCFTNEIMTRTNWTYFQLRNISYRYRRTECEQIRNLDLLLNYTFEEALHLALKVRDRYQACSLEDTHFETTYEYLQSCKSLKLRQRLSLLSILAKVFACVSVGLVADLYGRKFGLLICLTIWTVRICLHEFGINWFISEILYISEEVAKTGMTFLSVVLFMELCHKDVRALLTLFVNGLGPLGNLTGMVLKEGCQDKMRALHYLVSIPIVMLVFYLWFIPESPRWHLSYGRKKKAWQILETLGVEIKHLTFLPPVTYSKRKELIKCMQYVFSTLKFKKAIGLGTFLISNSLAIRSSKDKYIAVEHLTIKSHHGLLFVAKLFSHMYVIPPFLILGRHLTIAFLFVTTTMQIFTSIFIRGDLYILNNVLTMLSCYCLPQLLLIYFAEIFPTSTRCTCTGMIMSGAYLCYLFNFLYQDMLGANLDTENVIFLIYLAFGLVVIGTLPYTGTMELPDYKVYR